MASQGLNFSPIFYKFKMAIVHMYYLYSLLRIIQNASVDITKENALILRSN